MEPSQQVPPPRKRRWWIWVLFGTLAVGTTVAVLIHVNFRNPPLDRLPFDQLKDQIRREVPPGSTRTQLEAWAKRRLGRKLNVNSAQPEEYKGRTFPEAAGVPWSDIGSTVDVDFPVGWYTINGETAPNQTWVYFTLNDAGEVVDYHFLTLEQLAGIEKSRLEQRSK